MRLSLALLLAASCAASLSAAGGAEAQETVTVAELMKMMRDRHRITMLPVTARNRGLDAYANARALDLVKQLQPACDARIANFFRTGDPRVSDPSIPVERLLQMTLPKSAVSEGLMGALASDYIWCLNAQVNADPELKAKTGPLVMNNDKRAIGPRPLEESLKLGAQKGR